MWIVRKVGFWVVGCFLIVGEVGIRGIFVGIDDGGDNNIFFFGWGFLCVLFMFIRSGVGLFGGNRKKKRIKKR